MKTSTQGQTVLKYFEQCKLEAYPDPGSKDGTPWTIGWGHTGPDVVQGLVWTQEQADRQLVLDLVEHERDVMSMLRVDLTQWQFDALVLIEYNIGKTAFKDSTLLRKINGGDTVVAADEFPRWNKNDGQVMRGLVRRRAAERYLFLGLDGESAIAKGVAAA